MGIFVNFYSNLEFWKIIMHKIQIVLFYLPIQVMCDKKITQRKIYIAPLCYSNELLWNSGICCDEELLL